MTSTCVIVCVRVCDCNCVRVRVQQPLKAPLLYAQNVVVGLQGFIAARSSLICGANVSTFFSVASDRENQGTK